MVRKEQFEQAMRDGLLVSFAEQRAGEVARVVRRKPVVDVGTWTVTVQGDEVPYSFARIIGYKTEVPGPPPLVIRIFQDQAGACAATALGHTVGVMTGDFDEAVARLIGALELNGHDVGPVLIQEFEWQLVPRPS